MNTPVVQGRTSLRSGGVLALAASLLLAGGVLAACGGSKAAGSSTQPGAAAPSGAQGQGQAQGTGAAQFPGASGTLAEIDGNTLQVQNPSTGQVAVSYAPTTTFTQTRATTVAAIKVGDCVSVTGVRNSSSAPSASSSASPATPPTSFPAASVAISAAVNGTCTAVGGFGGGGGGGGGRFGGVRPSGSGAPSSRPSGAPSGRGAGRGGFGDFATGTVSALAPGTLTVHTVARGQRASSTDTITLTSSTTYTESSKVTAAALKVGLCVFATGKSDSTGAVAATRIALSTAGPNGCSTGFGRRPAASSSTGA